MNSLVGDSRTKNFKIDPLVKHLNDNWSKPGAGILAMEKLIRKSVIMHHGEDQFDGKLHIYISAGICDVTTRILDKDYEETIFDVTKSNAIKEKILKALDQIQRFTLSEDAMPIFTTIYPLSLKDWNNTRLRQNKTKTLRHSDKYDEMQQHLESLIEEINKKIVQLNVKIGMATPLIHKFLLHNRGKGKFAAKYNLLVDGCHPSPTLKQKIANSIKISISKNRSK